MSAFSGLSDYALEAERLNTSLNFLIDPYNVRRLLLASYRPVVLLVRYFLQLLIRASHLSLELEIG